MQVPCVRLLPLPALAAQPRTAIATVRAAPATKRTTPATTAAIAFAAA